ncbi:histidine kinase dimerization/phosphoacceptor domain -containing protein [Rhodospirillum rubrum]|uniref:histidine kinase n=1 Tax=Rhodospirillum rubrum (strain ATCC 11170 / ATH 1.1.1 / DSM 467 / LMG 4362 / NCIMB 8255 / S1) TaxID=269796 RepID=Q2RWJ8_RHORT|nr:histidine kinase dimerization/phosphoacceptor domain -containing protein [Rhodospirillum rubrum]ABC21497.1 signal transduction histidine kinase [Rhodospirillum rubrum ATCC 11170]AEO47180.1 signal transduction histidine kinase [Rhodospirillum rubrum F11]MBK5953093.1 histidine kinase [Rhodospirillum rubrum]QXG81171.1 GAF domain-containing protein [Rhodospirillum rubrum]HCF18818.1 histidine kinase [Rhodospirillum rubrum]
MDETTAELHKLISQQAAIAHFGNFALREPDLMVILTEAARLCAEGLSVPFCKVCRYRAAENDLLVVAGYGWNPGVVGHVVSRADLTSPQGRAFITGNPSICDDVSREVDFELPSFYAEHGVVSTIDVLIKGDDLPYGVLEIDNDQHHDYDQHDIDFLTGFANVLAEAVATSTRTQVLNESVNQMRILVEEKDRLLEQKNTLAEELQHRVKNNLQLVYAMLSKQLGDTVDPFERKGLSAIARRVFTLAQVYDHLLGREMTRTTDFGSYLKSLCASLADIQGSANDEISLTCTSDSLSLDLDVVTALGLAVAELVANAYDHAFPDGRGTITVSALKQDSEDARAILTIADNGKGFSINGGTKRHGVGLVRRLIEQIGASATVVSDQGTVWTILIPTPGQAAS